MYQVKPDRGSHVDIRTALALHTMYLNHVTIAFVFLASLALIVRRKLEIKLSR